MWTWALAQMVVMEREKKSFCTPARISQSERFAIGSRLASTQKTSRIVHEQSVQCLRS